MQDRGPFLYFRCIISSVPFQDSNLSLPSSSYSPPTADQGEPPIFSSLSSFTPPADSFYHQRIKTEQTWYTPSPPEEFGSHLHGQNARQHMNAWTSCWNTPGSIQNGLSAKQSTSWPSPFNNNYPSYPTHLYPPVSSSYHASYPGSYTYNQEFNNPRCKSGRDSLFWCNFVVIVSILSIYIVRSVNTCVEAITGQFMKYLMSRLMGFHGGDETPTCQGHGHGERQPIISEPIS